MMKAKLGLLAIPVVLGLGAVGFMSVTPAAHAAPTSSSQQTAIDKETPDANEKSETNKVDDPNGPNVEQTGQNETAN